jgi:hypothetical protein
MYRHTGYVPTLGKHVRDSALCASCHTLFTDALTADGQETGHLLLEQGPYVEWQNSRYSNETDLAGEHAASCQDCHVPTTDQDGQPLRTRIARNPHGWDFPPVRPRSPFGRHVFIGGNTLVPSILRSQLAAAGQHEAAARFDRSMEETRRLLRNETARIDVVQATREDRRLEVVVSIDNLTGHKLPTAYPSRRMWVCLEVTHASGEVVFASGRFDQRGRILDARGQVLPSEEVGGPAAPHYAAITSPDQVQIYESVMEDAEGDLTFLLLRGARYRKDNRLLPWGWTSNHPRGSMTSPVAVDEDDNFGEGMDTVRYEIDGVPERGALEVRASLFFQTLGARYAAELLAHDVPEMNRFAELYAEADPRPELLARVTKRLPAAPQ